MHKNDIITYNLKMIAIAESGHLAIRNHSLVDKREWLEDDSVELFYPEAVKQIISDLSEEVDQLREKP